MKMNRRTDTVVPQVCLSYEIRHVSYSRLFFFSQQPESRSDSLTGEAGSSTDVTSVGGGGRGGVEGAVQITGVWRSAREPGFPLVCMHLCSAG